MGDPKKLGLKKSNSLTRSNAISNLQQKEFSAEALGVLVEILRDKKLAPQHRLAAASQILDRSHGKARHHVDVIVDPYERYSNSQLIDFILGKAVDLDTEPQQLPSLDYLQPET